MTMPQDAAFQALQDQVRAALAARTPLDIRGHGSKRFLRPAGPGACGQPLNVTPLRGISAYEPSELVVTVRAGTPLAELEAALAERGQFLAFEPPRFATSSTTVASADAASDALRCGTVGGMVAAGLAGPARASVGNVRD
ncbi:MAG: hypothetical protein RLY71_4532, partial [Pseudomonadota bacterium]